MYKVTVRGVVRHCAVGRCLMKPSSRVSGSVGFAFGDDAAFDKKLKPEYRGHGLEFWGPLQHWHDDGGNFTDKGISQEGRGALGGLKAKFK